MSSGQRHSTRRGKHGAHTLEFPDPGKKWRRLFILLSIILGMGFTTVLMKKMAKVGDLREEIDLRKHDLPKVR
jgi:hypothetical protein